jgi:hypothetical protein
MLRKLLIATALLTASGTALAHSDSGYGRVIAVEPRIAISFGAGHHDGFRVLYESAGSRHWTHTSYHPGRTIVLPPRHHVRHVHQNRDYGRGWKDRRGDWRDGHHESRRDHRGYREQRRHGRD